MLHHAASTTQRQTKLRPFGLFLLLLPVAILLGGSVSAGDQQLHAANNPGNGLTGTEGVAFVRESPSLANRTLAGLDAGMMRNITAQFRSSNRPEPTPLAPLISEPAKAAEATQDAAVAQPEPVQQAVEAVPAPPRASTPQERGGAALGRISYPWPQLLPGWQISFHAERKGVYGLTLVEEKRIEVYVRGGQSEDLLAHVIAHEIGHAVDVTRNAPEDRTSWQTARGIGNSPWWPGNGTSDFSTGAGDFAESFAFWQLHSSSFRSNLSPAPVGQEISLMQQLALD